MRAAVIGHVEWVEFVEVDHVPAPGEIVEVEVGRSFGEPAGGGGVAAVQLARLAGDCTFYTALGDDDLGRRAVARFAELGVRVEPAIRPGKATRRAFTFLDARGERTITTIGERHYPTADDPLPWAELAEVGGVYFVAGDPAALRAARLARGVVATARVSDVLAEAGVELDAVVGSGADAAERHRPIEPPPRYLVTTAGARGGTWSGVEGRSGKWAAATLPGPVADAYGCGDSFAAGLAYGFGEGLEIDGVLELAARCGAACMTGHGPYGHLLSRADL